MEIISEALKEKNLAIEQLSTEIQEDIAEVQNMAKKYNEACDEYEALEEPDAETEKDLDEMEAKISALQEDIAKEIKSYNPPAPPEPEQEPATTQTKKPESSSSGMGWLLLGGVALVITLGAVNVFKKK